MASYPIDPRHEYNANVRAIQDSEPVRASTSVGPAFTQIINNVETLRRKIEAIFGFHITIIVDSHAELMLIVASPDGTIALVRQDETQGNRTALYEALNDDWVFLTFFDVDLANYVTHTEMNDAIAAALASIDLSRLDVAVSTRASQVSVGAVGDAASATGSVLARLAELINNRVGAVNATGGTTVAGPANAKLNELLTRIPSGGLTLTGSLGGAARRIGWWVPGTYTWQIPTGITEIWISACGGGGSNFSHAGHHAGGGGGAAILMNRYVVVSNTTLTITVGDAASTTIISGIVTLNGGSNDGTSGGQGGASGTGSLLNNATVFGSNGMSWTNGGLTRHGGGGSLGGGGGAGGSLGAFLTPPTTRWSVQGLDGGRGIAFARGSGGGGGVWGGQGGSGGGGGATGGQGGPGMCLIQW